MLTPENINKIIAGMSPEEKGVLDAIRVSNNLDEKGVIDAIINDVQERRTRLFDVLYIDLSIDRSTQPLIISGGGTFLACIEATDSAANCTLSFETENADTNSRVTFKSGKRIRAPFSRFYIYHSAQSGKTMKIMRGFDTKSLLVGFEDNSSDASTAALETALGNSTTFATNQVSVTNSATVIKAANTNRKRITIKNPASNSAACFIGIAGVAANTGHQLDPGDAITLNTTAAVYGIHASATQTLTYLEE